RPRNSSPSAATSARGASSVRFYDYCAPGSGGPTGFKFAPMIGEILDDLGLMQAQARDRPLSLQRFVKVARLGARQLINPPLQPRYIKLDQKLQGSQRRLNQQIPCRTNG